MLPWLRMYVLTTTRRRSDHVIRMLTSFGPYNMYRRDPGYSLRRPARAKTTSNSAGAGSSLNPDPHRSTPELCRALLLLGCMISCEGVQETLQGGFTASSWICKF